MSVWFAVPSARPAPEVNARMDKWRAMGYKVALWRDQIHGIGGRGENPRCDLLFGGTQYPGYSITVNQLAKTILFGNEYFLGDPGVEWIVTGGDDTDPDPNKRAEEIAAECSEYFAKLHSGIKPGDSLTVESLTAAIYGVRCRTFGVMQPTGDRWGENEDWARAKYPDRPAYIDRICGSPWMGREFCRRMYGGNGPMWPEYFHMFNDEELQCVAEKLGVLWQRRDLIQYHDHWGRDGFGAKAPEFLDRANSPANWDAMKTIFETRKAAGFPGHEPIA